MTMIFDVKHKSFRFERKIFLKMTKSKKSEYHVLNQSSLFLKKLKSFKIVRKMNSLIYELELSNFMKNHSIIFVIHLKQVKKNSFERTILTISSSLTENDEKVFVIERILKKRILNDTKKLLIKWKEWDKLTWKSENTMTINVSKMIKKFRQKKKLHDFKSNATKSYSFIAKNRVIIVFLLTYFIFFLLILIIIFVFLFIF